MLLPDGTFGSPGITIILLVWQTINPAPADTLTSLIVITKPLDIRKIANMVKTRIEVLPQIADHIDFFEELPQYDISMYTHKKMKTDSKNSLELLKEVLPILETTDDYSNDNLFGILSAFGKEHEYKTGFIMWPIRTALSGKQMTPAGATEIMEILGKDESIKRIKIGIDKLQQ